MLGGEISVALTKFVSDKFLWEQISYVMPFDGIRVHSSGSEWRLLYHTDDDMEYHNHLKINISTLDNSGYGLFADRTFFKNDIISVYLGENVTPKAKFSPYAMDFPD